MTTTQTALITGASRGLGLALARELARRGWSLLVDARGAEALTAARAELSGATRIIALAGDVTDAAHRDGLSTARAPPISWSPTRVCARARGDGGRAAG